MTVALGLLRSLLAAAERVLAKVPVWAASLEPGSWPLAAVIGLAGLGLLLAGLRLGRVVTALGGAILGWLLGGMLAPLTAEFMPERFASMSIAILLGVCSALAPALYPIALGATCGALLGTRVPIAGSSLLGSLVFGVFGLALALVARRVVLAATAAVAGAILVSVAALAVSGRVGLVAELARRPLVLGCAAAVLAVAGAAFQLGHGPLPARARPPRGGEGPPPSSV
ncbi:MAG TPA: hypothetical protein VLV17_00415 [Anaeromyxobacteraceae bacterium]|nr:hypothetical protein [Anaeromyxobacteraceae bacterium]